MTAATDREPARKAGAARTPSSAQNTHGPVQPGHALPIGTRLRDYEITELIGAGAFGIVYLAYDHSLQRQVAIKEYMPIAMATRATGASFVGVRADHSAATYRAGLKSFLNEARLLARFDNPSLVKVYRFWEENGTAYMVMPYYAGPTLQSALADLGHVPTETELRIWLRPILNAVTAMHEGGFYHHHIGPDNIRLTETGPVLLDFAAARRVVEGETETLATSLKPGYAAIEQYGDGAPGTQGAWTDLYALAAVLYAAITGAPPMPAPERLAQDGVLKLRAAAATLYSDAFLHAIDAALSLQPENRPRDHAQFRALMRDIDAPNEAVALSALRDLMLEPFVVDLSRAPGEITVPNGLATADVPRRSRPGALGDLPSPSTPGALDATGPRSRPGELAKTPPHSKPGALGTASITQPGAFEPTPSGVQSMEHSGTNWAKSDSLPASKKTLSPKAARIAAAHEHSGEPSDLHPDVDFSALLEPTRFFDRFSIAAKAGLAIVALVVIGFAVWLAKPADDKHGTADVIGVPARDATRFSPTPTAPVPVMKAPTATGPEIARSTATEPASSRSTAASPPDVAAPITAATRAVRCVEILQKVSLEPMTPADAAFYKKECQR